MRKSPSAIHPDLTDERIDTIGNLIASIRSDNLNSADERDTGWSLGCRAYTWVCSGIIKLAESTDWLNIVELPLKFIFSIGSIEVSFYKGDSTTPKNNIYNRVQSYPEINQLSLLVDFEIPEKLVWSYAVETDYEGETTSIEFFGMSESGEIIASRYVPIHQIDKVVISDIKNTEEASVVLPPAKVRLTNGGIKKVINQNE